jgi:hypothetical protein
MNTRNFTLRLKANCAQELNRIVETNIIPMLRKHKGFRDEMSFVAPERSEALIVSVWDTNTDADSYTRTGHPEILQALSSVTDGTAKVEAFELCSSNSTTRSPAMERKLPSVLIF